MRTRKIHSSQKRQGTTKKLLGSIVHEGRQGTREKRRRPIVRKRRLFGFFISENSLVCKEQDLKTFLQ
jgi:hypothetical protein